MNLRIRSPLQNDVIRNDNHYQQPGANAVRVAHTDARGRRAPRGRRRARGVAVSRDPTLTPAQALSALLDPSAPLHPNVFDARLPRTLLGLLGGAALALAGILMQDAMQNRIAGPRSWVCRRVPRWFSPQ